MMHTEECGFLIHEGAEEILLWRTSRRCKLPWYLLRRVRGRGNDYSSREQYSWRRGVVLSLLCDSNTTRKYTQLVISGKDWSKFCCTSRILRNRHRRISSGSFWKQVRRDCERMAAAFEPEADLNWDSDNRTVAALNDIIFVETDQEKTTFALGWNISLMPSVNSLISSSLHQRRWLMRK